MIGNVGAILINIVNENEIPKKDPAYENSVRQGTGGRIVIKISIKKEG